MLCPRMTAHAAGRAGTRGLAAPAAWRPAPAPARRRGRSSAWHEASSARARTARAPAERRARTALAASAGSSTTSGSAAASKEALRKELKELCTERDDALARGALRAHLLRSPLACLCRSSCTCGHTSAQP